MKRVQVIKSNQRQHNRCQSNQVDAQLDGFYSAQVNLSENNPQKISSQNLCNNSSALQNQLLFQQPQFTNLSQSTDCKKIRPPSADYKGRNRARNHNVSGIPNAPSDIDTLPFSPVNAEPLLFTKVSYISKPQRINNESITDIDMKAEESEVVAIDSAEQDPILQDIYIDTQESYMPGIDSVQENGEPGISQFAYLKAQDAVKIDSTNLVFCESKPQIKEQEFIDLLDQPLLLTKDAESAYKQICKKYESKKRVSLSMHTQSFRKFSKKEKQLIHCFKVQNENPNTELFSYSPERKVPKKFKESEAVLRLKSEVKLAEIEIKQDLKHKKYLSEIVSDMQKNQWDGFYSDAVSQISMSGYFKKSTQKITDLVKNEDIRQLQKLQLKKRQQYASSVIKKQDGSPTKELICHQKASAVIQLKGKKRNAPNLKLGNPRSQSRPQIQSEIQQIRRKSGLRQQEQQWREFMGVIKQHPETLMSVVMTPGSFMQNKDILQAKSQQFANSPSYNASSLTRPESGTSACQGIRKRISFATRPLTGTCQNQINAIPMKIETPTHMSTKQFGLKTRPLTGKPQTQTNRIMKMQFYKDLDTGLQNSMQKVETVLRQNGRGNESSTCLEPEFLKSIGSGLEQISESTNPHQRFCEQGPKINNLGSSYRLSRRETEINIAANSAQKSQAGLNQSESNYLSSNAKSFYTKTFLNQFNMSNTLIQKLGVQKKVRYFKDSTLYALTGINPAATSHLFACIDHKLEPYQEVDWYSTQLWTNIQNSQAQVFNSNGDRRYLNEEQVTYCINLLRYCSNEFQTTEKMQQMFNLVIGTTQAIYLEMGLTRLFDRISNNLDAQADIDLETCTKLLVRCQLMLSLRTQIVKILKELIKINQMIDRFACMQLSSVEEAAQKKVDSQIEEVDAVVAVCYGFIRQLIEERQKIIGKTFIFDKLDFAAPKNLQIKATSTLLQKLNEQQTVTVLQRKNSTRVRRQSSLAQSPTSSLKSRNSLVVPGGVFSAKTSDPSGIFDEQI